MEETTSGDTNPRLIWDGRYAGRQGQLEYEPWLARWLHLLPQGGRILDLGCGRGYDSRWLSSIGFAVIGSDFSFEALRAAKVGLTGGAFLQQDLREGLPYLPEVFAGVVANLSLHYFSWAKTREIIGQVRACLEPGAVLLARFNSTRDTNFGAEGWPQVEPNAFWVEGMYKRYFDRESLVRLFAAGWRLMGLEELSITRYGPPKVVWETVVIKDQR